MPKRAVAPAGVSGVSWAIKASRSASTSLICASSNSRRSSSLQISAFRCFDSARPSPVRSASRRWRRSRFTGSYPRIPCVKRRDRELAGPDVGRRGGSIDARGQSERLRGGLRDPWGGERGRYHGMHSRKGRAHQFGRRLSARFDAKSRAGGVFTRTNADGADAAITEPQGFVKAGGHGNDQAFD